MKEQETVRLLGVTDSLAAGMEFTVRHLWLLCIPLLLELLLWAGPTLSAQQLLETAVVSGRGVMASSSLEAEQQDSLGQTFDLVEQAAPNTNLLRGLSVPILGVPALLARIPLPEDAPQTAVIALSPWEAVGSAISLFVTGLMLTTIFYGLIASLLAGEQLPPWINFFYLWQQLLLWISCLLFVCLLLLIPVVLVVGLMSLLSPLLAQFLQLIAFVSLFWLIVYNSFGPHGFFLVQRPVWEAVQESVYIVNRDTVSVALLFMTIMLIHNGFNYMWSQIADSAGFILAAVLINSFLGTALIATTFIFYQNRRRAFLRPQEE